MNFFRFSEGMTEQAYSDFLSGKTSSVLVRLGEEDYIELDEENMAGPLDFFLVRDLKGTIHCTVRLEMK